jgi:hypothetical protein
MTTRSVSSRSSDRSNMSTSSGSGMSTRSKTNKSQSMSGGSSTSHHFTRTELRGRDADDALTMTLPMSDVHDNFRPSSLAKVHNRKARVSCSQWHTCNTLIFLLHVH